MQLKGFTDTNVETIMGRTVEELAITMRVGMPTAGPLLGVDGSQIVIKATLHRNGQETVLFQENLAVLLLDSGFHIGGDLIYGGIGTLVMGTVGGNTIYAFNYTLDMMMPINLTGNDKIVMEGTCNATWLDPNCIGALSYIDFQWQDAVGVEKFIPIIRTKAIQANAASFDEALGDNITRLTVINKNLGAISDANAIITMLSFASDKYDLNLNVDRMVSRRSHQFESNSTAMQRGRCFCLIYGIECDSVRLQLTMNPANVTAGANYIVYRSFVIDGYTWNKAQQTEQKHEIADQSKLLAAK